MIEPFDEGPDVCYEDCRGMCFGCYDGYKYSLIGGQVITFETKNLLFNNDHELDMLIDALDDKGTYVMSGVQILLL